MKCLSLALDEEISGIPLVLKKLRKKVIANIKKELLEKPGGQNA